LEAQDPLAWRRGQPWHLLERDAELSLLSAAANQAKGGEGGRLIFITGEAGIGKSALIRQFAATHPEVETLVGVCEPMGAAEALAPLFDIAGDLGPAVLDRLTWGQASTTLYALVIGELQEQGKSRLVCFEDVQWADQATLDLLRFIGRRADRLSTLVVATFREEDAGTRSPLTLVLGDLATASGVQRIELKPLSEQATTQLAARTGTDPQELHRRTGGNPFFITEILAAGGDRVPATVRDAVLARVQRLADPTRLALEAAAAIGPRFDESLFEALIDRLDLPRWTLHSSVFTGMLRHDQQTLEFRHSLAQTAIAEAIPAERLQNLHQIILDELRQRTAGPDAYPALVLHAERAGDSEAVAHYAPLAADRAAAFNAHREAAALYAKALHYSKESERMRPLLAERQADELGLSGDHQAALAAYRIATVAWRAQGDALGLARSLIRTAALSFLEGNHDEADRAETEAIAHLELLPASRELAQAYESRARHRFMTWRSNEARQWASKALVIAVELGDEGIELQAGVIFAASGLLEGAEDARAALLDSLDRAQIMGDADLTARTAFYLMWLPMLRHDYRGVEDAYRRGIACADEHQLDYWRQLLTASWVRFCLEQGRWREAIERGQSITASPAGSAVALLPSLTAIGRIRARRGEPGARQMLDKAMVVAAQHPALEAVTGSLPASAEAAWLEGDLQRAIDEARAALAGGAGAQNAWWNGELCCWLRRSGAPVDDPPNIAEPYALELNGNFESAAAWWDNCGCHYEAAIVRTFSDGSERITDAIATFDSLGATPAAAWARNRLRSLGVSSVPRGPRPSTTANPARLTQREQEVLELVAQGLSNPAIGKQLFLSPKTVERHLSSVLSKLDATTRSQAVERARAFGALPPAEEVETGPSAR
jgi:DNA-binding CsgD family transcriptional regulator